MTIQSSLSKALYYGDGNSVNFAFNFKVFNTGQIDVTVADNEGNYDVVEADSINLNSDGTGTVVYTLDGSPLPEGYTIAITRNMDFLQEKSFINGAKFDAEVVEACLDQACAERQQIREMIGRAILVPVTSPNPPEVLAERIFEAVDLSTKNATITEEVKNVVLFEKDTILSTVSSAGSAQISAITGEGNAQVARLENLSNLGGLTDGLACMAKVISVTSVIEAGTTITASDIFYVVGRNHLRVLCDGIALSPTFFTEIGEVDTLSRSFSVTFDLEAGQELELWVSPLGRAELASALVRLCALEDALAELSRKVVYAEATL